MGQVEPAHKMGIPIQRINMLINGKRDMTTETAIVLSHALKTSSKFWMNLRVACDLYDAQRTLEHAAWAPMIGQAISHFHILEKLPTTFPKD